MAWMPHLESQDMEATPRAGAERHAAKTQVTSPDAHRNSLETLCFGVPAPQGRMVLGKRTSQRRLCCKLSLCSLCSFGCGRLQRLHKLNRQQILAGLTSDCLSAGPILVKLIPSQR